MRVGGGQTQEWAGGRGDKLGGDTEGVNTRVSGVLYDCNGGHVAGRAPQHCAGCAKQRTVTLSQRSPVHTPPVRCVRSEQPQAHLKLSRCSRNVNKASPMAVRKRPLSANSKVQPA